MREVSILNNNINLEDLQIKEKLLNSEILEGTFITKEFDTICINDVNFYNCYLIFDEYDISVIADSKGELALIYRAYLKSIILKRQEIVSETVKKEFNF